MRPFEYVILFFSFVFSLALAHLLLAAAQMVRHRRALVFSWPHGLWMLAVLVMLCVNWISYWDAHTQTSVSIAAIAFGFFFVAAQYLLCALVTPDFEHGHGYDLTKFHAQERTAYLTAFLAVLVISIGVNLAGASGMGLGNWAEQNGPVLVMAIPILAGIFVPWRWVQIAAPLAELAMLIFFGIYFYPALS